MRKFVLDVATGVAITLIMVALVLAWDMTRGARPEVAGLLDTHQVGPFAVLVAAISVVCGIVWAVLGLIMRRRA